MALPQPLSPVLDRILHGDCLTTMPQLPAQSIDTLFADPPYFLQLEKSLHRPNETKVHGVEESWDKFNSFQDYDAFSHAWLTQARRLLKDDGTLWVMGSYHNIYRIGAILQNLGFWILNDVLWVKTNPMPNFQGKRFTNAHETLLWCSKKRGARYRFNYRALKQLNGDKQMRSDWHLPICNGAERLRDKNGAKIHSTQKPLSLLYRVLIASTRVGDVVLDPFCGSGTTPAACLRLGRHYIGIEREAPYVRAARKRLKGLQPTPPKSSLGQECLLLPEPREQARDVPFSALLENGILLPGEKLESPCRQYQALVTSEGLLSREQRRASIHQWAAELAGRTSCNGWTYWYHLQNTNKQNINTPLSTPLRVPLNDLREALRKAWRIEKEEKTLKQEAQEKTDKPSVRIG